MVAPSRPSRPQHSSGFCKKLIIGFIAVGAIIFVVHNPKSSRTEEKHSAATSNNQKSSRTEDEYSAAKSSNLKPSRTEETYSASKSSPSVDTAAYASEDSNQSNLRGSPSGSSSENEKKTVPMQQKVKATNENSIVEEKSKFEKGIEQEEKDRKHLDDIIAEIKDEVNNEEDNLVLKVEDKLKNKMQNSKERLKGIMDGVLEGEDKDKILDIEDKVGSLVDEKVRYDLFKAAEDITIQKDQEIDQVVLEDVVKGMKSSDIEIDIEELEANLLEDLTSEINEAEHQIELKLNETVKSIEKEVISETLGINVDIKDLSAPEEKDTAITVKNKKKKNKVKKRESAEDEA